MVMGRKAKECRGHTNTKTTRRQRDEQKEGGPGTVTFVLLCAFPLHAGAWDKAISD